MKNKLLLIFIVIFAFLLRVVLLSSHPLGFTWDEAALGYNAYSLLKTGRDEYGQLFPIVFKSFGDYKPGLYIYFSALPVFVSGLTIFATRFSSAIFGSLSVLVIFVLIRYLYPRNNLAAFGGAILLAISPWAIHFSRGAWEANLCLFLTLCAVTLFISRNYAFSVLFFGLTFFTYQGAKLFTPALLVGLLCLYRSRLTLKKHLLFLFSVFLFTIPILIGFSSQSGRLKVYSVFSYTRTAQTIATIIHQDNLTAPNTLFNLFHSEKYDQMRGVAQRFLNHLSPRYLFVSGDWSNLRHSIPYQGYFYYPEIIVLLIGLVYLLRNHSPESAFLIYWVVVAIIPSAFSRDIVSGVRSLPLVIPLIIICGIGLSQLIKYKFLAITWSFALIFFFIYFMDLYFIHAPKLTGQAWLASYQPAIALVSKYSSQYSDIYFSDKLGQPYIFILFFNQINPVLYQKQAYLLENAQGDVGTITSFGKYHFGPIYWPSMRGNHSSLFIGDIFELPEKDMNQPNLADYGLITYPDGAPAFRVVGLQ